MCIYFSTNEHEVNVCLKKKKNLIFEFWIFIGGPNGHCCDAHFEQRKE